MNFVWMFFQSGRGNDVRGVSYPPNPYLSKFLIFNFPKFEEFGGKREGSLEGYLTQQTPTSPNFSFLIFPNWRNLEGNKRGVFSLILKRS